MNFKKAFALTLSLIFTVICLSACGKKNEGVINGPGGPKYDENYIMPDWSKSLPREDTPADFDVEKWKADQKAVWRIGDNLSFDWYMNYSFDYTKDWNDYPILKTIK